MIYETTSEQQTFELGIKIGGLAKASDIYCLSGELGVGKTIFAKGFAVGLGISEHIVSPTFTIVNVYEGRLNFYHFDMYRIQDADEIYNIGFEEYFYSSGICLVEWPEMVEEAIPEHAVRIRIEKNYTKSDDYRIIRMDESL